MAAFYQFERDPASNTDIFMDTPLDAAVENDRSFMNSVITYQTANDILSTSGGTVHSSNTGINSHNISQYSLCTHQNINVPRHSVQQGLGAVSQSSSVALPTATAYAFGTQPIYRSIGAAAVPLVQQAVQPRYLFSSFGGRLMHRPAWKVRSDGLSRCPGYEPQSTVQMNMLRSPSQLHVHEPSLMQSHAPPYASLVTNAQINFDTLPDHNFARKSAVIADVSSPKSSVATLLSAGAESVQSRVSSGLHSRSSSQSGAMLVRYLQEQLREARQPSPAEKRDLHIETTVNGIAHSVHDCSTASSSAGLPAEQLVASNLNVEGQSVVHRGRSIGVQAAPVVANKILQVMPKKPNNEARSTQTVFKTPTLSRSQTILVSYPPAESVLPIADAVPFADYTDAESVKTHQITSSLASGSFLKNSKKKSGIGIRRQRELALLIAESKKVGHINQEPARSPVHRRSGATNDSPTTLARSPPRRSAVLNRHESPSRLASSPSRRSENSSRSSSKTFSHSSPQRSTSVPGSQTKRKLPRLTAAVRDVSSSPLGATVKMMWREDDPNPEQEPVIYLEEMDVSEALRRAKLTLTDRSAWAFEQRGLSPESYMALIREDCGNDTKGPSWPAPARKVTQNMVKMVRTPLQPTTSSCVDLTKQTSINGSPPRIKRAKMVDVPAQGRSATINFGATAKAQDALSSCVISLSDYEEVEESSIEMFSTSSAIANAQKFIAGKLTAMLFGYELRTTVVLPKDVDFMVPNNSPFFKLPENEHGYVNAWVAGISIANNGTRTAWLFATQVVSYSGRCPWPKCQAEKANEQQLGEHFLIFHAPLVCAKCAKTFSSAEWLEKDVHESECEGQATREQVKTARMSEFYKFWNKATVQW